MDESFPRKEGIILRKLYISQYKKKLLGVKSGSFNDFIKEVESSEISEGYIRCFLKKLVDNKVLIFNTFKGNENHYYVDKERIFELISNDPIFQLDKQIIDDHFVLLE